MWSCKNPTLILFHLYKKPLKTDLTRNLFKSYLDSIIGSKEYYLSRTFKYRFKIGKIKLAYAREGSNYHIEFKLLLL